MRQPAVTTFYFDSFQMHSLASVLTTDALYAKRWYHEFDFNRFGLPKVEQKVPNIKLLIV